MVVRSVRQRPPLPNGYVHFNVPGDGEDGGDVTNVTDGGADSPQIGQQRKQDRAFRKLSIKEPSMDSLC